MYLQVISAGFKPVSPDDVSRTSDNATPKEVSGSEPSRKDSSTFLFSMSSSKFLSPLVPYFLAELVARVRSLRFVLLPFMYRACRERAQTCRSVY